MSLLDLSTDVADDGFGLDVDELEMDIGADIFRPSATLADDSFLKDEFSLDAMSLEPLSFCEFGPFSPPSSPRLCKKDASFTHQETGGIKPEPATSLPPKYFKTVRSSPQKRRMISRTLGQIKSFSFSTPPPSGPVAPLPVPATPLTVVTRMSSPKPIRPKKKVDDDIVIKEEPIEAEPEPVVTPKRQAARMLLAPTPTASPVASPLPSSPEASPPSMASPLREAPSSPSLATPVYVKKEAMDDAFSPMVKLTNKNVVASAKWMQDMPTLPPRYYRGPDSSPEKKRAHSTTFGRMSSFSFKMPKLEADDDSVNLMKRGASMVPQPLHLA